MTSTRVQSAPTGRSSQQGLMTALQSVRIQRFSAASRSAGTRWSPPAPSSRRTSRPTLSSPASQRSESAGSANAAARSTRACAASTTAAPTRTSCRSARLVPAAGSERRTFIRRMRFRAPMIPIARPILGEDELAAVKDVLASGMLAQGAKVKAFEEAFARDVGRKHGIAVANGTAALHVALLAHGLKAGAEVVIPPLTFFATASTVVLCGAKPVFADVDRTSYNMDPTKARLLRDHGQTSKYEHVLVGFNYRMTEIAAAIGLMQLKRLDGWVKARRANARELTKGLDGIDGLVPPSEGNWMVHAYYQYVVRREDAFPLDRDEIVRALTDEGIGCRPSYPMPLYRQKALRDLRIHGRCPVTEDLTPRLFELPVHPGVGPADLERIVAAVEGLSPPS